MQAQHYAKTKMDYLVFNGYNSLAAQGKTVIDDSDFKDSVALGTVSTDTNGVSHRTVTVSVYKGDEVQPRAKLQQVFYSNDANRFVVNGSSATNSISMNYDAENDKLYAKVDGKEKELGSGGGVPVGTVIAWPFNTAPTEYGTWLLCDGSSYSAAAYPKLYALSKSTVLPDLRNRFLEGSATAGNYIDAGLPDIQGTGSFGEWWTCTGCFKILSQNTQEGYTDNDVKDNDVWEFRASYSNPIYGKSDTVQPSAYTVRYYIKAE